MASSPAKSRGHGPPGAIEAHPGPTLCVYCRRIPIEPRWRPFCSERCRLQDLAQWIDGNYRVAGEVVSPEHTDEADEGP